MKTIKKNNKAVTIKQPVVSAERVQEAISLLAKVEADFGNEEYLGAEDKRHALKPRKGYERIVDQLGALAKEVGLDSAALHSDDMIEQVQVTRALAPLEAALEKLLTRVSSARFSNGSGAWSMGLQFYALLQRIAVSNPEIAVRLAPIEDFFSYRHESVLEAKPTKLETRAKKQLAAAERLMSRVKPRAGAEPSAVPTTPTPTKAPSPSPIASPAPIQASPAPAVSTNPVTTTVNGTSKPNGVLNGAGSDATNGYVNGAGTSGPS
jgi:hypothetical protein